MSSASSSKSSLAASCALSFGLLLAAALLSFRTPASSAPVIPSQVEAVVTGWLLQDGSPLGASLGKAIVTIREQTDDEGNLLFYVVNLHPSGCVIVSADDLIEPIIAFSESGRYDPTPENPLFVLLMRDLVGRMAEARSYEAGNAYQQSYSSNDGVRQNDWSNRSLPRRFAVARARWETLSAGPAAAPTGLSTISDLRVAPFVQSKWSQSTEFGNATYNYYTPPGPNGSASNYYCGCVATAAAQLMRYHQYPIGAVGVGSFNAAVCGFPTTLNLRGGDGAGGPYNWASMVLDPTSSITLSERQAIGALCYDAGVAVNMNYCETGSSADTLKIATALKSTFGYSNAKRGYNSGNGLPSDVLNTMINSNLHAALPVVLGITGAPGGHAVICDGYGYNGSTCYHHLNMGWAGAEDEWYNLPYIDSNPGPFDTIYKCIYNVYPTGTGEIIAGRVTNASGSPLADVLITAQKSGGGTYVDSTDDRGIYALAKLPSNSTYTLSAQKAGYTFPPVIVSTGASTDNTITCGNRWGIDFVAEGAPLTVTLNQAVGQPDPVNYTPILFTAVFSEAVADFTADDVTVGGSAPGEKTVNVSGGPVIYTISVGGLTASGTVTASIAAGVAHSASGMSNSASVSSDNTVVFDIIQPSVTIEQSPSQTDPTHDSTVDFIVRFSENVIGFTSSDVIITGTAGGTKSAQVTGGPATYSVAVSGMTSTGTVVISIASGIAQDAAGNTNTAAANIDNSVSFISAGLRVAEAKKLPNGASAAFVEKAVTAVFEDHFYVEEMDRSAGLRVRPVLMPAGITIGSRVDVLGIMKTDGLGERFLEGTASVQEGITAIRTVTLVQNALGGADWSFVPESGAGQSGVLWGTGLNNIGLLVKVYGKVLSHEPGVPPASVSWFVISDGSSYMKLPEGAVIPIESRVICPSGVQAPAVGSYVCVTGISTCVRSGSDLLRAIRPRGQADIQVE